MSKEIKRVKSMKSPKCPYCKSILIKIYYRNGSTRAYIGFICRSCKKIKLKKGLQIIYDDIYSGLTKLEGE